MELRHAALQAYLLEDPSQKVQAVNALWVRSLSLTIDPQANISGPNAPGRPAEPALVSPQQVPHRSPFTPQGHAALVHSIAHIEFNAIDLGLDAVWRFGDMPEQYYQDWLRVAAEEAKHFALLQAHLRSQGYDYGDFVAHTGLWDMCQSTCDDLCARMALVPRTLEARGLDATPLIQAKLRKVATPRATQAVAILDIILQDEVGHVAIGNHWFHWLCQRDGIEPRQFGEAAALTHRAPRPKPPYNLEARRQAGFTEIELQALP